MEIIGILLFLATLVGLLFLGIFFWAWRGDQFDNIEAPARRMLYDDEAPPAQAGTQAGEGTGAPRAR